MDIHSRLAWLETRLEGSIDIQQRTNSDIDGRIQRSTQEISDILHKTVHVPLNTNTELMGMKLSIGKNESEMQIQYNTVQNIDERLRHLEINLHHLFTLLHDEPP